MGHIDLKLNKKKGKEQKPTNKKYFTHKTFLYLHQCSNPPDMALSHNSDLNIRMTLGCSTGHLNLCDLGQKHNPQVPI